jgi:peptidoglycan/LPS O-acetylase OafA/YrhL
VRTRSRKLTDTDTAAALRVFASGDTEFCHTHHVTVQTPLRPKFEFADGLRAVAALTVAVYHAMTFTGTTGTVKAEIPAFWTLMQIGNYAVPVFIVLSGFVLMLPVARDSSFELRGGLVQYIGRRAKRILPPYYVSLALFLLLIWMVPVLQADGGTAWDNKVPVTPGGLLSHLFLVHNWNGEWIYQINGPAWSIATEWQIYFLLPLVLLPLWRRIGPWWTVSIALAAGFAIGQYVPFLQSAHYWFIGLFGLGMFAAHLAVRGTRLNAGWPAAILSTLAIAWVWIDPESAERRNMLSETLAGTAVSLALLWLGNATLRGERTWLHRVLETRFLAHLGLWSYSFYLVHSPLLGLANLLLLPLGLPAWAQLILMLCAALPAAAGASYLFHVLVERRFMTSHQRLVAKNGHAPG